MEPAEALARIPGRESLAGAPALRLGGLTNRVYRMGEGPDVVVLRLPGAGTEAYIDRAAEAANARAAAAAGVSPEVLHFGADGVMLTAFIPDAATMTPALFAARPGAVERAARAFRRLHTTAAPFAGRFELFAMIDDYLGHLERLGATLPEGYHDVVAEAGPVRAALAASPVPLAPCHCDPLCENFLDAGERMWIVDWEYSGNNDPLWDLGDLSVEGEFDPDMDARLIAAYFDRPPTAAEAGRMTIHKAMCDLLWTLWGLIQHANGNPADDFWAYSLGRLRRCRALMADPAFGRAVAAVAGRP
ncbi:choline kinase family protein [Amaricoccus sp.]|uniref:choline kinase family protein n=1 Tax=Amaricoccus sp. TaxID=1872485 RepID=UPI001B6CA167|nr:choline kinase family protein [Amaricoccus sp.]MBP7241994.1 phosphotransferase [Amaricoccus sp.]